MSFGVEAGERVCLIGRNGSGKSTLLKIAAGIVIPDAGEVRREVSTRIAYLSQEPELDEGGTVFENVAGGLGELRQVIVDYHKLVQALNDPQTAGDADSTGCMSCRSSSNAAMAGRRKPVSNRY